MACPCAWLPYFQAERFPGPGSRAPEAQALALTEQHSVFPTGAENPMELTFDRGIYSDAVLSTAAYWLSGEYAVERTLEGSTEVWKITRADAAPLMRLSSEPVFSGSSMTRSSGRS